MTTFNAKWVLKSLENVVEYFDAIGTTEEYKTTLRALAEAIKVDSNAYIEEFTVDTAAQTTKRVIYVDGEKKKDSGDMVSGVEYDRPVGDGRPAKVKVTIESDTIITRIENGDGFSTSTVFETSGDTMIETCAGGGQTCKMTYQRA